MSVFTLEALDKQQHLNSVQRRGLNTSPPVATSTKQRPNLNSSMDRRIGAIVQKVATTAKVSEVEHEESVDVRAGISHPGAAKAGQKKQSVLQKLGIELPDENTDSRGRTGRKLIQSAGRSTLTQQMSPPLPAWLQGFPKPTNISELLALTPGVRGYQALSLENELPAYDYRNDEPDATDGHHQPPWLPPSYSLGLNSTHDPNYPISPYNRPYNVPHDHNHTALYAIPQPRLLPSLRDHSLSPHYAHIPHNLPFEGFQPDATSTPTRHRNATYSDGPRTDPMLRGILRNTQRYPHPTVNNDGSISSCLAGHAPHSAFDHFYEMASQPSSVAYHSGYEDISQVYPTVNEHRVRFRPSPPEYIQYSPMTASTPPVPEDNRPLGDNPYSSRGVPHWNPKPRVHQPHLASSAIGSLSRNASTPQDQKVKSTLLDASHPVESMPSGSMIVNGMKGAGHDTNSRKMTLKGVPSKLAKAHQEIVKMKEDKRLKRVIERERREVWTGRAVVKKLEKMAEEEVDELDLLRPEMIGLDFEGAHASEHFASADGFANKRSRDTTRGDRTDMRRAKTTQSRREISYAFNPSSSADTDYEEDDRSASVESSSDGYDTDSSYSTYEDEGEDAYGDENGYEQKHISDVDQLVDEDEYESEREKIVKPLSAYVNTVVIPSDLLSAKATKGNETTNHGKTDGLAGKPSNKRMKTAHRPQPRHASTSQLGFRRKLKGYSRGRFTHPPSPALTEGVGEEIEPFSDEGEDEEEDRYDVEYDDAVVEETRRDAEAAERIKDGQVKRDKHECMRVDVEEDMDVDVDEEGPTARAVRRRARKRARGESTDVEKDEIEGDYELGITNHAPVLERENDVVGKRKERDDAETEESGWEGEAQQEDPMGGFFSKDGGELGFTIWRDDY